jgi:hypothetical protein
MANFALVDFYYGAALSHLLTSNSEHKPKLFEDYDEKRVFHITTESWHKYVLRTFCSTCSRPTKENAFSYSLSLSSKVVRHLRDAHSNRDENVLALVLVDESELRQSKIVYFTDEHLEARGVYSGALRGFTITIRKYKGKNDFVMFTDQTEENTLPVKQNLRFKE